MFPLLLLVFLAIAPLQAQDRAHIQLADFLEYEQVRDFFRGGGPQISSMLSRLASPATVNAAMAFVTGAISLYSSTSGVVMPAFLPTVPSVIAQVGGGDPLALALSINIGSSLVDVSPLSTLGALCVAAVADGPEATSLFRKLMAWGLAMVIVGAIVAALLAPMLAGI